MDKAYDQSCFRLSELQHRYGERVHILADPYALSQLAVLCSPATGQPRFSELIAELYRHLLTAVVNNELPRRSRSLPTRMHSVTPRAVTGGELLDTQTRIVCVAIARAGILPSQVAYDILNKVFEPSNVRQDHLLVSRVTDAENRVTGARIAGGKIGGDVDGRYVLLPDPMGATGNSLSEAIRYYMEHHGTRPQRWITLNLIVTPQFIRSLLAIHPLVSIYALRLDRGMSAPEVLAAEPGALTETGYIVPGGGGFGEILNNSFV
jgi:uracil phosphoribosyltransferase